MTKNEVAMITCKMVCEDCRQNHIFVDCIKDECATYLNKQALEKQIPKKLKNLGGELFCPVCDRHIHQYDCKTNYCSECGQALDWE